MSVVRYPRRSQPPPERWRIDGPSVMIGLVIGLSVFLIAIKTICS